MRIDFYRNGVNIMYEVISKLVEEVFRQQEKELAELGNLEIFIRFNKEEKRFEWTTNVPEQYWTSLCYLLENCLGVRWRKINKEATLKQLIKAYDKITDNNAIPSRIGFINIKPVEGFRQREINFTNVNSDEVKIRFKKLFNYK
jgi:hypothetical protein